MRRQQPASANGGDEPPPRFSVQRWAAIRECLVRSTVPSSGGRSPLAFDVRRVPMSSPLKRFLIIIGILAVVSLVLLFRRTPPSTPQQTFAQFFSDLSVSTPGYQKLIAVEHPSFTLKGGFCTLDFIQSPEQFRAMIGGLKASESDVLSLSGAMVKAKSKLNPDYPWMLVVQAHITNAPDSVYRVKIEGSQAYD